MVEFDLEAYLAEAGGDIRILGLDRGLVLPELQIYGDNLPQAWERAMVAVHAFGCRIETQYDENGEPPSFDCAATIVVRDPFAEPRIHRSFPGGIVELEVYRQEMVDGLHNHWIDPEAGMWEYTYHERLTAYQVPGIETPINQLDYVVDALVGAPHTRRAQAVIWQAWKDAGIHDPACLQRLWFRIFDDVLVMNIDIRSNDGYKGAFMNMYAFTDLQRVIAERVSARLGRPIHVGQYGHRADSLHIYGEDLEEFQGRFLGNIARRTFAERTWSTVEVADVIAEANDKIVASLEEEKETGRKGIKVAGD